MNRLWRRRRSLAALALCAQLSLGGCGQKGALYLPDPVPQAVPAAAPAATPAADEASRRKTPRTPDPATTK